MMREKVERGVEAAKRLERHIEEIAKNVTTKDTMTHFVNAGTEIIQAANTAVKQMNVPEETRLRIHKAEREVLLAVKSAIEVILAEVDKEIQHQPAKKPELKKIEIKQAKRKKK